MPNRRADKTVLEVRTGKSLMPVTKLTKRYVHVENYTDLPKITIEQIQHFFEHYKDLEPGKWVKMIGWGDREEAKRLILEAIERAKK